MRVLGVDPGSRFMGYGVVEERQGQVRHIAHGVLRADAHGRLEDRLRVLFDGLTEVAVQHAPDAVAVEGVFTLRNARSALVLGHARGVALLVAAQRGLAVHEYAPARVKKAMGCGGAGNKSKVAQMVCRFLALKTLARADATDALAIALCHLRTGRMMLPTVSAAGAWEAFSARLRPNVRRAGVAL
ncbi:MAG: crossover junction endodeoxyribonuclease RuvC [Myxococcaceae bacterium]